MAILMKMSGIKGSIEESKDCNLSWHSKAGTHLRGWSLKWRWGICLPSTSLGRLSSDNSTWPRKSSRVSRFSSNTSSTSLCSAGFTCTINKHAGNYGIMVLIIVSCVKFYCTLQKNKSWGILYTYSENKFLIPSWIQCLRMRKIYS